MGKEEGGGETCPCMPRGAAPFYHQQRRHHVVVVPPKAQTCNMSSRWTRGAVSLGGLQPPGSRPRHGRPRGLGPALRHSFPSHLLLSFHIPHIEEEIAQISKSYPKRVRIFSSLIVLLAANLLPMKPAGPECWKKSHWLPCTAKSMSVASRYCVHCGVSDYFRFTDTVVLHEKESSMKEEEESGVPGEVLLRGSHGDLSDSKVGLPLSAVAGKSRKLMTNAMATSKSGKSNDVGADSAQNNQKHSKDEADRSQDDTHTAPPASKRPPTYPDILDIAGMDYSPAKRKPPIHN
ncbi:hypothetical protein C4D60_Mb06t35870 [Musa balbisiana]|uniref:Uncharacterized protein n=1 Tax=Musa balbisiana TaxID=52838 RepID=A0A4S8IUF0_MUSBA|nr:hypothetical protein C4D60_Mb06t35870 [Musa balbisiana]